MEIKKRSQNMRLVLLTATPMKNLASEVVSLVNLLRPYDKNTMLTRKILFNTKKRYDEKMKLEGPEIIR